jgi:Ca2+/H+ antiporter
MGNHAGGHHAEVVAHRVGQPFGSLILALSVTAIEAALIISMMLASVEEGKTIARDHFINYFSGVNIYDHFSLNN